jgi:hypothetical protein
LFIGETENIREALIKFRQSFSNVIGPHPVDSTFSKFLDTIKEQFRIFDSKVTKNSVVNLWMLSSLNEYFKIASKEFRDNNWLTTRFQFFGEILNATFAPILENDEFLEEFTSEYEIFTVLVIPPKRFLNYRSGEKSDPDWDKFIKINIEARRKELQINRHFLSLDFEPNIEDMVKQEFGDESLDLKKSEFIDQLNTEYWFAESAVVNSSELIKKDAEGNYLKVHVDSPDQQGYSRTPLRNILDMIHCSGACKVIELQIPSDKTELEKFDEILWDSQTEKTIDYFAIRERRSKKWVLCYRTVYDKTFDFAEIEILFEHPQNKDKWNDICRNLNQVFLTGKTPDEEGVTRDEELGISLYPISSYS